MAIYKKTPSPCSLQSPPPRLPPQLPYPSKTTPGHPTLINASTGASAAVVPLGLRKTGPPFSKMVGGGSFIWEANVAVPAKGHSGSGKPFALSEAAVTIFEKDARFPLNQAAKFAKMAVATAVQALVAAVIKIRRGVLEE